MASGTLRITMDSFLPTKADPLYVVASLLGDSSNRPQHIPIRRDNGSRDRTFLFTIDEDAARDGWVNFTIKKFKPKGGSFSCLDEAVGEVNVPVSALLGKGGTGSLVCQVKSPSGSIEGVLQLSYKSVAASPPLAMNADSAHPLLPYPAGHGPPMPCPAPLASPLLPYGHPPTAGHGYPAPPMPLPAPNWLPPPYAQCPAPQPPPYMHPLPTYVHAAPLPPPPHPGRDLVLSVISRVVGDRISNWLNDGGCNDWFSCFDM